MTDIEFRSPISAAAQEVFDWHVRPGAFERLTAPWDTTHVIARQGSLNDDSLRVTLRVPVLGPLHAKWFVRHDNFHPERFEFRDVMERGPFRSWTHVHRAEPVSKESCELVDDISYTLPLSPISKIVMGRSVHKTVRRAFEYRHRITAADIDAHRAAGGAPMRIAITGATGMIGRALSAYLSTAGHTVFAIVRPNSVNASFGPYADPPIHWDPMSGTIDAERFEDIDAVINLAGEPLDSRWTASKRQRILDSRVVGTQLLAATLAGLTNPPKVFVSISASGYYGDRDEEILEETTSRGNGFLSNVTQEWETACDPARAVGIRVVNPRLGLVMSPAGAALGKLLLPFQLGGGGIVGSGRQYWPWIALDDALGAIEWCLHHESIVGAVNVSAPTVATNREFVKTLGRVLHRPTILPAPSFALRAAFGRQMADEMLLASARMVPSVLVVNGFSFRFPELEPALRHLLGR